MMMVRQGGAARPAARRGRSGRPSAADDALAVRAYLRALVGAPLRAGDTAESTEASFIGTAARWSRRTKVDRRTLLGMGVESSVLDAAGVYPTPVADIVRRYYTRKPFSVAVLARRAGVSTASARSTVSLDEASGQLAFHGCEGNTALYVLDDR